MSVDKYILEQPQALSEAFKREAFEIGFEEYFNKKNANNISAVLNSRNRNVRLQSVTYRQLNSWEEQGLLTLEREGREWRRLSIMDALWIKIIQELREFGLPWEKIKNAKESLVFKSDEYKVPMPLLEFYAAFAIGSKMPVLLMVFKEGMAIPASQTQYKVTRDSIGLENHLQINLNDILQGLFPNVDLKAKKNYEIPVSLSEMELLAFLRIGQYERIEVKYKNGKMEHFEGTERISNTKRIQSILNEATYQDILVRQQDGKVTSIQRTIKKRFKKGNTPK